MGQYLIRSVSYTNLHITVQAEDPAACTRDDGGHQAETEEKSAFQPILLVRADYLTDPSPPMSARQVGLLPMKRQNPPQCTAP